MRIAGLGYRVDRGKLQPETGAARLRHQRPPLLRAADARASAQHLRHGKTGWRYRAIRGADTVNFGVTFEASWRADHRNRSHGYRLGRRSQIVRKAAR